MENNDNLIDNQYTIIEKKGSGASSKVFLVKEINSEEIYAAKVLKKLDISESGEKEIKLFENEIKILNYLKEKTNNPFIIKLINSGEGEIVRPNKEITKNKYIILEYAEKGSLLDYIYYYRNKGLEERFGKIIFYKILQGIQACHKVNICHRDLKLDNILFDINFNPKICDFGLSEFNQNEFTDTVGTLKYEAPEILYNKPYNGFEVDIFSLGVTLFTLVTGTFCFQIAKRNNELYNLIKNKKYEKYWKKFENLGINLSNNFKNLFLRMVSYNPKERPIIEDILNDEWIKDIKDLNKEKFIELENEVKEELLKREIEMKKNIQIEIEIKGEIDSSSLGYNRSEYNNIKEYFNLELKPTYITKVFGINNCIIIKGDLNPVKFMNLFANKIIDKYENNCYIKESKKSLKFKVIFDEELDNDINEGGVENDEEENDNDYNEEYEINKKECIIKVKLLEIINEGYLVSFVKKSGELEDYYKKVDNIKFLVKDLL